MGDVKAANTYPGNEIVWEEDYKGNIVVSAAGPSIENATIPSTINGKPVKIVRGFKDCKYLKTVTLPNTLTEIQNSAFEGCSALTTINIPDSIKKIGYWVFDGCSSLKSINLKNVTEIDPYAFDGCESLSSVTLSNNLTIIDDDAFRGCSSLKSITLPSSLKTIGQSSFRYSGLTTITVPASVTRIDSNYGTFEGCKSLKTATVNAQLEEIPTNMFKDCTNLTTVKFTGTKKVSMNGYIFSGCTALTSVTLPANLTNISRECFKDCTSLTNITIPDTVESIGMYAFEGCSRLSSIKLPCGVRTIDSYAFKDCNSLKNMYFTKSIQSIANDVFYNTSTAGLTIYGYAGSAAKPFATEKGIRFVECKPVTSIKVSGSTSVDEGKSVTLTASVSPADAYDKSITWSSSNNNIATVNANGVVTGKSGGSVTITATSRDGTFIKGNYTVNVKGAKKMTFTDVKTTDWFYSAVSYTYLNGIISGYNDKTFAPNDKLTRGMIVTILYRMEGSPNNDGKSKFSDVSTKEYYAKAVKWAVNNGIVHGYDGTTKFGPNDNIIRQDLAAILKNYAGFKKKDIKSTTGLNKFKDYKSIDSYALSAMQWAVSKGVITGNDNGTLNPKGNATRAEAAAMIQKYCNKVGR